MRLGTQALGERGIIPERSIDNLERSLRVFVNMLHGSPQHGTEGRAQRSMTFDERLKYASQGSPIGFRFYPERGSNVVSHAFRRELLEEPESLLSLRQRKRVWDRVSTAHDSGWYCPRSDRDSRLVLDQLETAR